MLHSVTNIPATAPIMIMAGQRLRAGLDLRNTLSTIRRTVLLVGCGLEAKEADDMEFPTTLMCQAVTRFNTGNQEVLAETRALPDKTSDGQLPTGPSSTTTPSCAKSTTGHAKWHMADPSSQNVISVRNRSGNSVSEYDRSSCSFRTIGMPFEDTTILSAARTSNRHRKKAASTAIWWFDYLIVEAQFLILSTSNNRTRNKCGASVRLSTQDK
jgi:hypothetical protein